MRDVGHLEEERQGTVYVATTRATLGLIFIEHDVNFFARHFQIHAALQTGEDGSDLAPRAVKSFGSKLPAAIDPVHGRLVQLRDLPILCELKSKHSQLRARLPSILSLCPELNVRLGSSGAETHRSLAEWRSSVAPFLVEKPSARPVLKTLTVVNQAVSSNASDLLRRLLAQDDQVSVVLWWLSLEKIFCLLMVHSLSFLFFCLALCSRRVSLAAGQD